MKERKICLLPHTSMQFKGAWRASQLTFNVNRLFQVLEKLCSEKLYYSFTFPILSRVLNSAGVKGITESRDCLTSATDSS